MSKIHFKDQIYYSSGHKLHNFIESMLHVKPSGRVFRVIDQKNEIVKRYRSKFTKRDYVVSGLKVAFFIASLGIGYLGFLGAKKLERNNHNFTIAKKKKVAKTAAVAASAKALNPVVSISAKSEKNEAKEQKKRLRAWNEKFIAAGPKTPDESLSRRHRSDMQKFRVELYRETQQFCRNGYFIGDKLCKLDKGLTKSMKAGTVTESYDLPIDLDSYPTYDTVITVEDRDVCDLAKEFLDEGLNPVALNLANAHEPGGGVKAGCGAQEESIFRRSNYYQATSGRKSEFYPIKKGNVIYTPDVQVFRTKETDFKQRKRKAGYQLTKPYPMSFIAAAGYDLRSENVSSKTFEKGTRRNIQCILQSALRNRHDSIVLGALGAGAFKNDPVKVATMFKEALDGEFKGKFKKVSFAIIYGEDTKEKDGTLRPGLLSTFSEILT